MEYRQRIRGIIEGNVGRSRYKVTPASGKNIYNSSDPRNTWNGPIVKDETGEYRYHAYVPLYNPGSLGGPPSILHGVASNITGPWVSMRCERLQATHLERLCDSPLRRRCAQNWHAKPEICQHCGENPAFVIFPGEGGKKVFSLWVGGKIWIASSPDGPFAVMPKATYPGGNPAPVYHDGKFYLTNQKTTAIYTTTKLGTAIIVLAVLASAAASVLISTD